MTISPVATKYVSLAIPLAVLAGALLYMVGSLVPSLQADRKTIDNSRASVIALKNQRADIDRLRQDIGAIEKSKETLTQRAWAFTDEEAFFQYWDLLAEKHSLQMEGPTISESVPGTTLLIRPATVELQGLPRNVSLALNQIQTDQPMIAISQVTIRGTANTAIKLSLELTTVWK